MSSEPKKIVLTGIKPTGEPHLGNYMGAIKPALELARHYEARYFIADYHALNTVKDAAALRHQTFAIAACWLACGLDPQKTFFYRQSDIPEIFELNTILTAFTAKGLMNRAHAYKAAVDANIEAGHPADHQVNMGLYCYPILMAADILLFDTDLVPVGHDQKQHIEMAQDIAEAVNHNFKSPLLTVPQPFIDEESRLILGTDGRKMSKSYNNVIPLFAEGKRLRKLINGIVTNSQGIDEPKDPDSCTVFNLYKLFAAKEQSDRLAARYRAGGMGWGEAKQQLYELLEERLAPLRERYNNFMADLPLLEKLLQEGAEKTRALAAHKISGLRRAIGVGL
jgi:tryptophanyl-tRNA synthetase